MANLLGRLDFAIVVGRVVANNSTVEMIEHIMPSILGIDLRIVGSEV